MNNEKTIPVDVTSDFREVIEKLVNRIAESDKKIGELAALSVCQQQETMLLARTVGNQHHCLNAVIELLQELVDRPMDARTAEIVRRGVSEITELEKLFKKPPPSEA